MRSHDKMDDEPYSRHHDGEGNVVGNLLDVLKRRKFIILATVCLITGLAVLFSLQATPRYTAMAEIVIEAEQGQVVNIESVVEQGPLDIMAIDTQLRRITSNSHILAVVEELDLVNDVEFNPQLEDPEGDNSYLDKMYAFVEEMMLSVDGNAELVEDQTEPPQSQDEAYQATVQSVLDNMRVAQGGLSRFVSIEFTSTDSKKAADVANAIAELYAESELNAKQSTTNKASDWLAERVTDLREQVRASERRIEVYRNENKLVSRPGIAIDAQELSQLQAELIRVSALAAEKKARLLLLERLDKSNASFDSVTEVIASPLITNLRTQETELLREQAILGREYGDQHPQILQIQAEIENLTIKIEREVKNIIAGLRNDYAVTQSRVNVLQANFEEAKARSENTGHAEIELRELERENDVNRQIYQTFLTRYQETKELRDLPQNSTRVISSAFVPKEPSYPKPNLIIAVSFIGSMTFGMILAMIVDGLDKGVYSGQQLERSFGIDVLGAIPSIPSKSGQKPYRYLLKNPVSAYAEAVRIVRKSVEYSNNGQRSPQVVLVTSSVPGEGKTTFATSLAASAAQSNVNTVLVDLDLRQKSVAREIGMKPEGIPHDLVDYVNDGMDIGDIIYEDKDKRGLSFVPVKNSVEFPADFLASDKMEILLGDLRHWYDYIVIDCPPVLGLTDVKAVAPLADAVVFVVRWSKTREEVVNDGLAALKSSNIDVSGIVLAQVDLKRRANYGYGDISRYYKEYEKYYENS
ncbi:MAG: GumC family protein [Geminicoccaceae bacterium]